MPIETLHVRLNTATTEAAAAAPVEKPKPERKTSIDPQMAQALEKNLAHRPDKHELIERNILKGGSSDLGAEAHTLMCVVATNR